ncbi:MAG: hypothetical protein UY60_C0002G0043 [Parcubacteria group bacterium GW2011_GWB1_50_9]|uniref:Uncharacterized protein n=1 Tax=Candidatus Kaiserbacteria bacterium GW2011_GWC2_52_8b TaxID=1618676 RepID=A0A0G2AGV3_9BACT|nr:MAG: hypothetical protein UY60_C0002G0043 [Parcubacteria group bacterium GW2011_GWB1_50_9]KKW24982.1 MAG: hypothetical protein VE99_C0004G0019 [candidate division Kazan bacterium GW2011_GWC1_52_13]KKW31774.1 MAG: hypothetical protein UY74_C0007G0003 [Candidatus Kaiserbacteria bacterium GW2011_GWC2_52_8b]
MEKKAAVCFGDLGTVECIGEPVSQLISEGLLIEVFLDPKGAGKKHLTRLGIPFIEATEIDVSRYALVISGTNGKAQTLWKNASAAALKAGKPVIWCGDFYMSGCEAAVRDLVPTWLTTLDESGRKLALRARPDLGPDSVVALGNASYDDIAEYGKNRVAICAQMRSRLNLPSDARIVYFAASSSNQFDKTEMEATIDALVGSVKHLFPPAYILGSFHPADPEKDELEGMMRDLLDRADIGHTIGERVMSGVPDFVGADVAVVQYSTEGVKSSLIIPTAFVLLPSMRYYQRTRGGRWPFFPQIAVGAAEAVWHVDAFDSTLERMFEGEDGYFTAMGEACAEHFSGLMDGCSTNRLKMFLKAQIKAYTK